MPIDAIEAMAKAIWEAQRIRTHKEGLSHNRKWRDKSAPIIFWEGYVQDAKVAYAALDEIVRERSGGISSLDQMY